MTSTVPTRRSIWSYLPRGGQLPDDRFAFRHKVLTGILLAHLPVLDLIVLVGGGHHHGAGVWWLIGLVFGLAMVGITVPGRTLRASAVSLGLLLCAALLIHLTGGQTSMHFHFFVVLALVAFYQEWTPYLLAIGFTAVHHIGMSLLMNPREVFSDPLPQHKPVLWALIHAGFVIAACAANVAFWKLAEEGEAAALATAEQVRVAAAEQARLERATAELRENEARLAAERLTAEQDARARLQVELTSLTGASTTMDSNMREAAAAADEFGSSIAEISDSTRSASAVAAEAVAAGQEGRLAIGALEQASRKISNVVGVISAIARQTNLLALNATIEASRAGEAGRGFAVVANEVKDLAQETARSTDEIGQIVGSIASETTRAVAAIESIDAIIQRIDALQTTIGQAVTDQTTASLTLATTMAQASSESQAILRGLDDLMAGTA